MKASLGLNNSVAAVETPKGHTPLTLRSYTALELPAHLYMVALDTGSLTVEHWSYLMGHSAMVVQLATSNEDKEMEGLCNRVGSILNTMMLQFVANGVWFTSAVEKISLKRALVEMGTYYRDKPKAEITKARKKANTVLKDVMKQFDVMWAS